MAVTKAKLLLNWSGIHSTPLNIAVFSYLLVAVSFYLVERPSGTFSILLLLPPLDPQSKLFQRDRITSYYCYRGKIWKELKLSTISSATGAASVILCKQKADINTENERRSESNNLDPCFMIILSKQVSLEYFVNNNHIFIQMMRDK